MRPQKTAEVSAIFGEAMGGCALVREGAVLTAADVLQDNPQETVRHELTHLFSSFWGKFEPPLKSEGLATWLQGTMGGEPIDFHALVILVGDAYLPLCLLVDERTFHQHGRDAYTLAGSFTGFLVRRFGWDAFMGFFAQANARNFEAAFERTFGMTFFAAEREWRKELLSRRTEFEPNLSALVRRRRIKAAYFAGEFVRCLEECDAALRTDDTHWEVFWYAAVAHKALGNYEQAVALLEQVVRKDAIAVCPYRADAWLQLGNLYDLLGRRDKATAAYQQTLNEPDCWDSEDGSAHEQARRYLRQPFTERELYQQLKSRWKW